MPTPRCPCVPSVLAALGLLAALLAPVAGRADPSLDPLWEHRGDAGGLERAIEAHEAAVRGGTADVTAFERLLRMRFFRAQERLPAGSLEQKAEYLRCVDDGLRGLERHGLASDPAPSLEGIEGLDEVRDRIQRKAVGILYWTALCYGPTIRDAPLLRQPGGARRFRRLVECSLHLAERSFFGGPHRVLAESLHAAPGLMGGDDDEARRHAETAVRLFPGFPENPLCRAENVWRPAKDRAAYAADLDAALSAPEDAAPDAFLEYRAALDRARRLRTKVAERF
jgi:hypothetical protein